MASELELRSFVNRADNVAALDAHYKRALERILNELSVGLSRPGASRARDTLATIRDLIVDLDPNRAGFVRNWIRREIPKAFVLGDRSATRQLREELEKVAAGTRQAFGDPNRAFTAVNQTAMKGITAAMEATLGRAAQDMYGFIGTVVRRTQVTLLQSEKIREATVAGIIRGSTGQQVSDDIASILLQKKVSPEVRQRLGEFGFRGDLFRDFEAIARGEMITVGARRFSVRSYANLVARTQSREGHKVGTIVRLQQNQVNHVRVSQHAQDERDECTPFAGKVFYIGPLPQDPLGFPKLSSILNGGPPFHPNCKHVLEPYVVEFKSPGAVEASLESSQALPRRFFGKGATEVRELVGELSDKQLQEIAAEGFSDLAA